MRHTSSPIDYVHSLICDRVHAVTGRIFLENTNRRLCYVVSSSYGSFYRKREVKKRQ